MFITNGPIQATGSRIGRPPSISTSKLGLRRSYFQDRVRTWHYDVTEGKRRQAVALGALELTTDEMVRLIREREEMAAAGQPSPPEPITSFADGTPYAFLSNFALIPVTVYSTLEGREVTYKTAEHAFQAAKTLIPGMRRWVAAASTPGKAKGRGQRVPLRPGWDEGLSVKAMRTVLAAKFTPGSHAAELLLRTGDRPLIEGNTWCDNDWGDCTCRDCPQPGKNMLGKLLMELRGRLRAADDSELATDDPPFSNSTDGDAWTGRWCGTCIHDRDARHGGGPGCPLLAIVLAEGRTPANFQHTGHDELSLRYDCTRYQADPDEAPEGSRPWPPPAN